MQKKTIVAIKSGKTSTSRTSTLSHSASITGKKEVSRTFLQRIGRIGVDALTIFLGTLKIFQFTGALKN